MKDFILQHAQPLEPEQVREYLANPPQTTLPALVTALITPDYIHPGRLQVLYLRTLGTQSALVTNPIDNRDPDFLDSWLSFFESCADSPVLAIQLPAERWKELTGWAAVTHSGAYYQILKEMLAPTTPTVQPVNMEFD